MVAQVERVLQVLERQGMLGEATQTAEVGDVPQRNDEVIERNLVRMWLEPRRGDDDALLQIDGLHLTDVHLGERQQSAEGAHQVGEPDRSRDDLGQHRLEDEVVLLRHEDDLVVAFAAEELLEALRDVDATEPAAQDDDPLPPRGYRTLRAEDASLIARMEQLGAAGRALARVERRGDEHRQRRRQEIDPQPAQVAGGDRGSQRTRGVHAHPGERLFQQDVERDERAGAQPGESLEARPGDVQHDGDEQERDDRFRGEGRRDTRRSGHCRGEMSARVRE